MKSLFSPATALMNRMDYTRKFALLALMSMIACSVVGYSLFAALSKEINILQREQEGIRLVSHTPRIMQLMQQHRGLSAGILGGVGTMRDKRAATEKEIVETLRKMEGEMPSNLLSSDGWRNIKLNWERMQEKWPGWTQAESFTAHTLVIRHLLLFRSGIADDYALILDPEADSYYLIDTTVNKLPRMIEYLAQLRAYGIANLADRRVTEPEKIAMNVVIGKLGDALTASEINIGKVVRYNPALQNMLTTTSKKIADTAHQITGLVESDILSGRLTASPEDFYTTSSAVIDSSYSQMNDTLLSATEAILKARIARAENTLYTNIGIALLLLLIVTYFAAGIYHSIVDSVRSLARSASAFAGGDMSERVRIDTHDELSQIGDSFNEMADGFNAMLAARRQLEESRARLVEIMEMSPDLIGMSKPDGQVIYINRAGREMLGIGAEEELGYRIGKSHPQWANDLVLKQGLPTAAAKGIWHGETALIGCGGSEIPVLQVILGHRNESGEIEYFSTIMREISLIKQRETELQQSNAMLKDLNTKLGEAQNQLLQSEKMASIGQLAAGVAHEINNPIGFVYSNLGSLEQYLKDMFDLFDAYESAEAAMPEPARAVVQDVKQQKDLKFLREDVPMLMKESRDGITRVKKIVQNLKEFSHVESTDEWQWADLHKELDSTLNIVNNEIKYKADVIKEYGAIPEVECLPSQLNQVIMNLLVNASHAIEERGVITISTGQQGEEVFIRIADTGQGIPAENLKRIFDPFFTTKPVGKGTGLGLSLSYGIMQKHNGRIEVESEVGKGTAFSLWLPVQQAAQPA